MNVLFLTLAYHPDILDEVTAASKSGLQNQINNYQWAFINGLRECAKNENAVEVVNALPVGIFPLHYRKIYLSMRHLGENFQEIGGINVPWFKQKARRKKAFQAIVAWAQKSKNNRTVLIYSLYLPYLQAAEKAKKRFPDLKVSVIVADLPNELGISSGRRGLLKKIEYKMGNQKNEICEKMDGFILLTKHMAEALPIADKAQMVMEGLVLPQARILDTDENKREPKPLPVVLYSGTLNRELGIDELLGAFRNMPEYALWLCGKGDMEKEVADACAVCPNIHYLGFVSQQKALELQAQADVLINPRSGKGLFTRYSFPSKTLEYMRSGKPVLCYKLEGIPDEYDAFLRYIPEGEGGITAAIRNIFTLPSEARKEIGESARKFTLSEKSAASQCKKLWDFLGKV